METLEGFDYFYKAANYMYDKHQSPDVQDMLLTDCKKVEYMW